MRYYSDYDMGYGGNYIQRVFSDEILSSSRELIGSSRSSLDAHKRAAAYQRAFANLNDLVGEQRLFTGGGSTGLHDANGLNGVDYVAINIAAMVKSIAGYITVERGMDMPEQVLVFNNIVTSSETLDRHNQSNIGQPDQAYQLEPNVVSPFIGPDPKNPHIKSGKAVHTKTNLSGKDITFLGDVSNGSFIPGSVKINIKTTKGEFTVMDDGRGTFLAPAGKGLEVGTVNYKTGYIKLTFKEDFQSTDSYTINAAYDFPRNPVNKVKANVGRYRIVAQPETILVESNRIENMVLQRSLGTNIKEDLKANVTREYLKLINKKVIDTLENNYVGDTTPVDISGWKHANEFNSMLQLFSYGMDQVNTILTWKSFKSVSPSCYVVGAKVAELMRASASINLFVPNTEYSYIEDLIGHYKGIPVVLTHRFSDPKSGYVIHKTPNGEFAPIARGIFMPVSDLPEAANFNNPMQTVSGIFSYEGVEFLSSELVQRFELIMPDGLDTVAGRANTVGNTGSDKVRSASGTWGNL